MNFFNYLRTVTHVAGVRVQWDTSSVSLNTTEQDGLLFVSIYATTIPTGEADNGSGALDMGAYVQLRDDKCVIKPFHADMREHGDDTVQRLLRSSRINAHEKLFVEQLTGEIEKFERDVATQFLEKLSQLYRARLA